MRHDLEVSKSIKIYKLHQCLTFLSGTLEKLSKSRSYYGKHFSKGYFFPKFTGLPDMRILIDRQNGQASAPEVACW